MSHLRVKKEWGEHWWRMSFLIDQTQADDCGASLAFDVQFGIRSTDVLIHSIEATALDRADQSYSTVKADGWGTPKKLRISEY